MDVGRYFAYKRYFNTIIGPWDLSRIVDNGRLYILTEHNVFWTGLARSGLVRTPAPVRSGSGPGPVQVRRREAFWIFVGTFFPQISFKFVAILQPKRHHFLSRFLQRRFLSILGPSWVHLGGQVGSKSEKMGPKAWGGAP